MKLTHEPLTLDAVFLFGEGLLLGLFSWIGYRQLSMIDPFQSRGMSGLLIAALAGGIVYRLGARALVWTITAVIGTCILIIAFTPIIRIPAHALIRSDAVRGVDAVVVLSSGISDDKLIDQEAVDRLLSGLELIKRGVAHNLVVTVVTARDAERIFYPMEDQARLFGLVGDSAKLFYTGIVSNTHEEAILTANMARGNHWSRIAVVTSPMHSRRACATFEKQGLKVVCIPSRSRNFAVGALKSAQDRLRACQLWTYETLAFAEYRRRGWL